MYVSWYFLVLLDPVRAILKSSDMNLPFGTIRDDSVEKKGKNRYYKLFQAGQERKHNILCNDQPTKGSIIIQKTQTFPKH